MRTQSIDYPSALAGGALTAALGIAIHYMLPPSSGDVAVGVSRVTTRIPGEAQTLPSHNIKHAAHQASPGSRERVDAPRENSTPEELDLTPEQARKELSAQSQTIAALKAENDALRNQAFTFESWLQDTDSDASQKAEKLLKSENFRESVVTESVALIKECLRGAQLSESEVLWIGDNFNNNSWDLYFTATGNADIYSSVSKHLGPERLLRSTSAPCLFRLVYSADRGNVSTVWGSHLQGLANKLPHGNALIISGLWPHLAEVDP